ncbi:MAG: 2-amino-4-hydroxy-6-hydroxymethyldihydropteridine diphosphokinase [Gemmatimonadetes bacterium]|nr:2-amino-4-hydroxy-6-hydroxymethyldihydropteridine diphosphokinase [Gemmatimonadota bacterium]
MGARESDARAQTGHGIAVGLGSNLGDRLAHLRFAVVRLSQVLEGLRCSSVYETVPEHDDAQPLFLNACCVGRTVLSPWQLLSQLQDAERAAGRRRTSVRYGPRQLDLDLLVYGSFTHEDEVLSVPHPRMRDRAFVLVPLAEIAPEWVVPASQARESATVADLAEATDRTGIVRTELELCGS